MKRIAVFCDGTWNTADAPFPTNVHQLYSAVAPEGADGARQKAEYIPGVGSGYEMSGWRKHADRIIGGAFGVGVTRNILRAYEYLADTYEDGDEILIFGFSRGAFTARSLAGFLRASGLPDAKNRNRVKAALKRYRDMDPRTAPGTEESHAFRADYSSELATSTAEQDWREAKGLARGHLLTVKFLGVWDTVGALGVPGHYKVLARIFNGNYGFHDLVLSRSVEAARHAVSIDETRKTFPPSLWENMGELNQDYAERGRSYRQQWFPGDHGSVGGGGDIRGLSSLALKWIAEGADDIGLTFDATALHKATADHDVSAPLYNSTKPPGFVGRLLRKRKLHRDGPYGPKFVWDVAIPAKERWGRNDLRYRPRPLMHLKDELDA